jgi:hypothetical protein
MIPKRVGRLEAARWRACETHGVMLNPRQVPSEDQRSPYKKMRELPVSLQETFIWYRMLTCAPLSGTNRDQHRRHSSAAHPKVSRSSLPSHSEAFQRLQQQPSTELAATGTSEERRQWQAHTDSRAPSVSRHDDLLPGIADS